MNSYTLDERAISVLKYRPSFLKGVVYGLLSLFSIYLFFIFGSASGAIFTDPTLSSSTYQPFFIALVILLFIFAFNRKRPVLAAYLTGTLMVGYLGIAIIVIPDVSLIVFPLISTVLVLLMYNSFNSKFDGGMTRIWIVFAAMIIMFLIGGAVRFFQSPGEYSMLVGSIYDDENPLGVPALYYNGIVFYGRFMVVSVSLPIIILFSALSSVLVENYLGIFKVSSLNRTGSIGNIGKTANTALTALSCQCEGITATFPSIVATLLFAAVIPLLALSIALVSLTNVLLFNYFLKGKKVSFLENAWNFTKNRIFMYLNATLLILIPIVTLISVYYGLERNLLVLSLINISMFVYGILVVYGLSEAFGLKSAMSRPLLYGTGFLSTLIMFVWYYPVLTHLAAFTILGFILMSVLSVTSGILAAVVFSSLKDRAKRLYLQYITMMFSTLAIVVFYLTSISLVVIWPDFGAAEQLTFSLVLWGVSLPFVWFSTNIALNSELSTSVSYQESVHRENPIQ